VTLRGASGGHCVELKRRGESSISFETLLLDEKWQRRKVH
jgi:hypothetical protein